MMQTDLADDGLHPNPKGYRIMAPVASRAIDEAVHAAAPAVTAPEKKHHFPFSK